MEIENHHIGMEVEDQGETSDRFDEDDRPQFPPINAVDAQVILILIAITRL